MRIIGCDLHSRQQTLAMLEAATGEIEKTTLKHEGNNVREFYSTLPRSVRVGIEATGSMQWFASKLPWAVAAALVIVGAVMSFGWWRATQPVEQALRPLVRLDVDLGADVSLGSPTGTGAHLRTQ